MRSYNRPALLKFSAGLQGEFWGALKKLKGLEATVIFGDKESQVSVEELSTLWTGEYILLWQAPAGYIGDIRLGDQGTAVHWLSATLNQLDQLDSPSINQFDRALEQQLKDFQSRRDIRADGIAGMQTILKINAETLSGIPLLESVL